MKLIKQWEELKKFQIKISYNKDFIATTKENINIGSFLNGKFDMSVDIQKAGSEKNNEDIILTFNSIDDEILTGYGELAVIGFDTFLPCYTLENNNDEINPARIKLDTKLVIRDSTQ